MSMIDVVHPLMPDEEQSANIMDFHYSTRIVSRSRCHSLLAVVNSLMDIIYISRPLEALAQ